MNGHHKMAQNADAQKDLSAYLAYVLRFIFDSCGSYGLRGINTLLGQKHLSKLFCITYERCLL